MYQQISFQPPTNKNILLNYAMPLLTLISYIKHTNEHHNIARLKAQMVEEIKRFEQKLLKATYPIRSIIAARYCLCTVIDEAVLSRPWGAHSIWVQQSLLSLFHKETWGGERFYIILEEMAKDLYQNLDFLEFGYMVLSLGFEGKFFDKGVAIREEIRHRIFYRIRSSKEKPDKALSRRWLDVKPIDDQYKKFMLLKKLGITTFIALISITIFYNFAVYRAAEPLINKLDSIATVSPITVFSQVIQRPIINRGLN